MTELRCLPPSVFAELAAVPLVFAIGTAALGAILWSWNITDQHVIIFAGGLVGWLIAVAVYSREVA